MAQTIRNQRPNNWSRKAYPAVSVSGLKKLFQNQNFRAKIWKFTFCLARYIATNRKAGLSIIGITVI